MASQMQATTSHLRKNGITPLEVDETNSTQMIKESQKDYSALGHADETHMGKSFNNPPKPKDVVLIQKPGTKVAPELKVNEKYMKNEQVQEHKVQKQ